MKKIVLSFAVFSATFVSLIFYQNCGKGFNVTSGGQLSLEESTQKYFEKQGFYVFGDQVFPDDPTSVNSNQNKSTAFGFYGSSKWPENIIYFDFETNNIPMDTRDLFIRACIEWSRGANFSCETANSNRIISRDSTLTISNNLAGCWSTVGYRSPGAQTLNVGDGCSNFGIVLHELGHAIGFIHEHQRADRDSYIHIIDPDKLKPEWVSAISVTFPTNDLRYFNKPYDIDSIMHYTNWDNRIKTDGAKIFDVIANPNQIVPQPFAKNALSVSDSTAVKELYGEGEGLPQNEVYGPIKGWIDRVENGVIQGWACAENYQQQIEVKVFGGSAVDNNSFLVAAVANEASEPAVSSICKTSGMGHRFTIHLTPDQIIRGNYKLVFIYGIHPDPSGTKNTPLQGSGKYKIINTGGINNTYGDIKGWIDRVENGVIQGWACVENYQQQIEVKVFGGSVVDNNSFLVAAVANEASEPAVSAECKTSGMGHRFTISLTPDQLNRGNNKLVFMYGIHPDPSGSRNRVLQGSGRHRIGIPIINAAPGAQAKRLADAKAAAEAQTKKIAEARAAAEVRARLAAEAQAKKIAEARVAAEVRARLAAEAQVKRLAGAKAAAEAQAKKMADAKAAAEVRARLAAEAQVKRLAGAKAAAEAQVKKLADAKAAALAKKASKPK